MPECESCGAAFSNLTKCEFCGAVIKNTEKATIIEQKVTVQLIDTEKVKDAVNKVSDNVKETSNTIKPWLMLIGGIFLVLSGLMVLFTGYLEKFGYLKTIGCFVFGIGLITSAIKSLKG